MGWAFVRRFRKRFAIATPTVIIVLPLWGCLLALTFFCGCGDKKEPLAMEQTPSAAPYLVTVNGRGITQAEFDFESNLRPGMSAEQVMDDLIKRKAMSVKAEESGVGDTLAYKRDAENRLISEWLATTYNRERDNITVTEDELLAAYETRLATYITPALPRFAILYRKGRDTAELAAALEEAVALFESDRAGATNNERLQGFGKIAAEHSEDTVSRYRGGDVGWIGEGNASRIPEEVLGVGRTLEVGEVSETIIVNDEVYVIMKSAERESAQVEFKEALPGLRSRLLAEKRTEMETKFKESLLDGMEVKRLAEPVVTDKAKRQQGLDAPPQIGF